MYTLRHRCVNIYCDFKTSYFEIDHLKTILKKTIQKQLLRMLLIRVLNNLLITCMHLKLLHVMQLKGMFLLSCRSLEVLSFQIRKKLQKLFKNHFYVTGYSQSFFTIKDKLPNMLFSEHVYYKCGGCNATCHGNTKLHFKARISKYLGISHLAKNKEEH